MRREPIHTKVSPVSGEAMNQIAGLENWAYLGPLAQPRTPAMMGGVVRGLEGATL